MALKNGTGFNYIQLNEKLLGWECWSQRHLLRKEDTQQADNMKNTKLTKTQRINHTKHQPWLRHLLKHSAKKQGWPILEPKAKTTHS